MNVLDNDCYGLHTHIVFGEIHQSAVWIVGAIRVLGYVVAAAFVVMSYADEAHAMVVSSASCLDNKGRRYYIAKNSYGTKNPYGGLMYLSENYVRMKTVAVVVKNVH